MKVVIENVIPEVEIEETEEISDIEIKIYAILSEVFDVDIAQLKNDEKIDFLVDLIVGLLETGYISEEDLEDYVNEISKEFEVEYEDEDAYCEEVEEEQMSEAFSKRTFVIRKGRRVKKFKCKKGFKLIPGTRRCVKIRKSEQMKKTRLMKRVWKTKLRSKKNRMKVRRKRSMRKRANWIKK